MKLSVVICTRNRAHLLPRLISSINKMSPPVGHEAEIIFVDNASTDGTGPYLESVRAESLFPMMLVHEPQLGTSNAKNRGAQEATGDYVLYLDDDALPELHWLVAYASALDCHRPEFAGGPIIPYCDQPLPRWLNLEYHFYNQYLGRFKKVLCSGFLQGDAVAWGGNMAVRKDLFAQRRFDPNLGGRGGQRMGSEDTVFQRYAVRELGAKVLYVMDAQVLHLVGQEKLRLRYLLSHHYDRGISSNQIYNQLYWRNAIRPLFAFATRATGDFLVGRLQAGTLNLAKTAWMLGHLVDALRSRKTGYRYRDLRAGPSSVAEV